MFSTAPRGNLSAPSETEGANEDPIRRQVWSLLSGMYPQGAYSERRGAQRFAYPQLLYLTTVAEDGISPGKDSFVVVGRTLSESGLGFYHREPLAYRTMIASLENLNQQWIGFLLDLRWCRFNSLGWYESGGRFLQAVPSPIHKEGL